MREAANSEPVQQSASLEKPSRGEDTVRGAKAAINLWQERLIAENQAENPQEAEVWIEDRDRWIIAYTAFSPGGPLVSLAETKDFVSFSRLGPVMPPEDKDAAVFPRRFA